MTEVKSLTIIGGQNKRGVKEEAAIELEPGSVTAIVGPTGAGKSCLLADIECFANGDTPSRRRVLLNHKAASDKERYQLEGKLVAQLSQNMNFITDLTVGEFLQMHASSRGSFDSSAIQTVYECANELAGEEFSMHTNVTRLSGGQSRALMIADCAFLSLSPIVLIDEIENAGVDRKRAVRLLAGKGKITLMSTHDPLLALSADQRVVIQQGGIKCVIATSVEERLALKEIVQMDERLSQIRQSLRDGEAVTAKGESYGTVYETDRRDFARRESRQDHLRQPVLYGRIG